MAANIQTGLDIEGFEKPNRCADRPTCEARRCRILVWCVVLSSRRDGGEACVEVEHVPDVVDEPGVMVGKHDFLQTRTEIE